jgi:Holliday junction resolvasome RuvABC endonuclease subunit
VIATVLGLDLSLAGTGVATRESTCRHVTKGHDTDGYPQRLARIAEVRGWVLAQIGRARPGLAVIEGPAPNAVARISSWDRAALWWAVVEHCTLTSIPVAIAPPNTVKKFATGDGRCGKDDMIAAAYRRMPQLAVGNRDEADAAWLMAAGYHWLGDPVCEVPKVQAAALAGVIWPARVGALAA